MDSFARVLRRAPALGDGGGVLVRRRIIQSRECITVSTSMGAYAIADERAMKTVELAVPGDLYTVLGEEYMRTLAQEALLVRLYALGKTGIMPRVLYSKKRLTARASISIIAA